MDNLASEPRPLRVGDLSPMILAAGRATRLRPLTQRRAKAVVPFLNRPVLDYTLDWLRRNGFTQVTINLHHAGASIVSRYRQRAFQMEVEYSREPVLLGTAGGPRAALGSLGAHVLLVNGDIVTTLSLGGLVAHHGASGALATLALARGTAGSGYPQCLAADDGRLLAFPGDEPPEPAPVRGVFTGVHIVERQVLEQVPPGAVCGIVDPVYRQLMAAGLPLHAVGVPGTWYEVSDPGRYIDHQLASLVRGDLPLALVGCRRFVASGYVGEHVHLENVRPVAPFLLGAGVRVKHGSYLQAVVAGMRTRIESGSRLRQVVTWEGACIGAGCDLRRVIVMDHVRVAPGTQAEGVVFTPQGPIRFESEEYAGLETAQAG